ncbi:fimbrial biogenesis chaperone [Gaopeijia maritima]|uniref:fimbrial biogenesis chaperone n=1 Tax=Gaopeijia maritima TaxID=3119007 RepID=UPI0038637B22
MCRVPEDRLGVRPRGATPSRRWWFAAVVLLLGAQASAAEGQLQAGPTLLELRGEAGATRLTLSNPGETAVAAQIRVYRWLQIGGDDHLVETEAIGVSPPIAQIPPGGEQLVRLVRLGGVPDSADVPYRVVVEELPPPGPAASGRVEMRMRYVIPFFDRWSASVPPELSCRWGLGGSVLECANRGEQPAQLGATHLVDAEGGRRVLSEGLFGYVLPGSTREWAIDPLPEPRPTLLATRVNGRPLTVPVGGG